MATIVITGANRGIGLELARQCQARGDSVIAAVRRTSRELSELDIETFEGVDVTDDDSVAPGSPGCPVPTTARWCDRRSER